MNTTQCTHIWKLFTRERLGWGYSQKKPDPIIGISCVLCGIKYVDNELIKQFELSFLVKPARTKAG